MGGFAQRCPGQREGSGDDGWLECLSDIAMTETSKSVLKDGGVSISPLQNEKSRTSQDLVGLLTVLLSSLQQCVNSFFQTAYFLERHFILFTWCPEQQYALLSLKLLGTKVLSLKDNTVYFLC